MDRGQDGFAIPFLYDSFIHDFTPVYPDAIQAGGLSHRVAEYVSELLKWANARLSAASCDARRRPARPDQ